MVKHDQIKNDVEESVKHEATRDLIRHFAAILVTLSAFLGILGYRFEWLTQESIDAFVLVAYAVAGFGYTAYEIYKNKFATKKGQAQNRELKERNLK